MPRLAYRNSPETFWSLVDRGEPEACWPFTRTAGAIRGYGRISYGNRLWLAHRLAYHLERGPIPDGKLVRHRCDNPPCCNPAHLELGDDAQNTRDREARSRGGHTAGTRRGAGHPRAALTEERVREIRRLRAEGATYVQIAAAVGTTKAAVGFVVTGKTWVWLDH